VPFVYRHYTDVYMTRQFPFVRKKWLKKNVYGILIVHVLSGMMLV